MKVIGIVGWKNSGKTGLVERLVAEFSGRGLRVATIKHAHHKVEIDQPGRDSFRHRAAGAAQVMLATSRRWALMTELGDDAEPGLEALLARLDPADLVLVEGFKTTDMPKIECSRSVSEVPPLAIENSTVVALAADHRPAGVSVPILSLDDTVGIAGFISDLLGLGPKKSLQPDGDRAASDRSGDCFALPQGVSWMSVDDALGRLRGALQCGLGREQVPFSAALGRVLAEDVIATRASPPLPNVAVDGYAFAHAGAEDGLTLVPGRSAPGAPFPGVVERGEAVRVLTGAPLPDGADTVVMQEYAKIAGDALSAVPMPKKGANVRQAGEDLAPSDRVLLAGRVLGPQDLALAASAGVGEFTMRRRLRVAVLSTGNELGDAGDTLSPSGIFDANRPMLAALAQSWGYKAIDLGIAPDDRAAIAERLDRAAASADVILTSGGASAGDEDHMAALLREEGHLNLWRVAIKPGRPLALGHWGDVPVFGLPGNPVAAFVCALIFARPALSVLAGGEWLSPMGFSVPAGFERKKKAGRREFQRARIGDDGRLELFSSEGSGRISGLVWADGLAEFPDEQGHIRPGDPVRFIPFGSFGL